MNHKKLQHVSSSQRERIFHIDFRLLFLGTITRTDLIKRFGIKEAAATRDLTLYREIAPDNCSYDTTAKKYYSNKRFKPVFKHSVERSLHTITTGIGDDFTGFREPLVINEVSPNLSNPDVYILAAISRAIHQQLPVKVDYYSTTSGYTVRTITPLALVNSGLRWHVRAYDRKKKQFSDFVMTRITQARTLEEGVSFEESREADNQWNRIVELELVPHPNLKHPETIALDYPMVDGVLRLSARAAVVGYVLRRWLVDCSTDHSLNGAEYQLWLRNTPTLYGVNSAFLAPGYRSVG